MTIVPVMSMCPEPQGTAQRKEKVPASSVGMSTYTVCPSDTFTFTPRSAAIKLWSPVVEVTFSVTFSPCRKLMAFGMNAKFWTSTSTTRTSASGAGDASVYGMNVNGGADGAEDAMDASLLDMLDADGGPSDVEAVQAVRVRRRPAEARNR